MVRALAIARCWAAIVVGFLGVVLFNPEGCCDWAFALPTMMPLVAGVLIQFCGLWPHVLARFAWTWNLVLGGITVWLCHEENTVNAGAKLAVCSGAALLLSGRGQLPLRRGAVIAGAVLVSGAMLVVGGRRVTRHWDIHHDPYGDVQHGVGDRSRAALIQLQGRVVRPDGEPFEGVKLSIITAKTPHTSPEVVGSTTTNANGRFTFDPVSRHLVSSVVLDKDGTRHGHHPGRTPPDYQVTWFLGDIPFDLDRSLLVSVDCEDAPAIGVAIHSEWQGETLILNQYLTAPGDAPRYLSYPGLLPGFDDYQYIPPQGARHFQRTFKLPPGTHRITASEGCGTLETQVAIPAEGEAPPLRLTLAKSARK